MTKLTAERGRNILLGLLLIVGLGNLWSFHTQADSIAAVQQQDQQAQAAQQRREAAAQAKAAAIVEHRLCVTLGKLAALTPPAGNPATNPSRLFESQLHNTLSQLGPDLGCSG